MKIEWKKWLKGGEEGKKDLFSAIFPFLLLGAVIILGRKSDRQTRMPMPKCWKRS